MTQAVGESERTEKEFEERKQQEMVRTWERKTAQKRWQNKMWGKKDGAN